MTMPIIHEFSAGELRKLGATLDPRVPDCALVKGRLKMNLPTEGQTKDTIRMQLVFEPVGPLEWFQVNITVPPADPSEPHPDPVDRHMREIGYGDDDYDPRG